VFKYFAKMSQKQIRGWFGFCTPYWGAAYELDEPIAARADEEPQLPVAHLTPEQRQHRCRIFEGLFNGDGLAGGKSLKKLLQFLVAQVVLRELLGFARKVEDDVARAGALGDDDAVNQCEIDVRPGAHIEEAARSDRATPCRFGGTCDLDVRKWRRSRGWGIFGPAASDEREANQGEEDEAHGTTRAGVKDASRTRPAVRLLGV
jgi:hypothetical protein